MKLNLTAEHADQLMIKDPDAWSGMTLAERDTKLIVLNPTHSRARQCATLMHELVHIVLDHAPASAVASISGLVLLSDYSDDQESEAEWLGAALLLPEAALLHHRAAGKSPAQIAQMFGVSLNLCNWRCRMTGVEKRLSYRRSA
jgi:Zn-dependent peptidase ImmA (M78 family)